ncbi:MAG: hypothetical protein QE271_11020 [Bacteriovoracaceae bacterium]|nr:hypothetical protein [Bacteriovoracaceae bacterium]
MAPLLVTILAFFNLVSCGSYTSEQIELTEDQLTAIRSKLSSECTSKNAGFFNELKAAFANAINVESEMGRRSYYKVTDVSGGQTTSYYFGVYKISNNKVYFITLTPSTITPDQRDRVFAFTLDDQNKFFSDSNNLTSTICTPPNIFNPVVADFNYTIKSSTPDSTAATRTENIIKYKNSSNLPLIFSIFNYDYTRNDYINNANTQTKRTVTMAKETLPTSNTVFEEQRFDEADHCQFDSVDTWAAVSATGINPTTLADCVDKNSSSGRLSWDDVNPTIN